MEYFRDERNQIYADIAHRLGKIVVQYDQMILSKDKFDSTLHLAVLQSLMSRCNEHVKQMTRSDRRGSIFSKNYKEVDWGLSGVVWENTFNEKHTLQNFILRLRNSISHPLDTNSKIQFPNTGFSTLGEKNKIEKYLFFNSPDVKNNRPKIFSNEAQIKDYLFDSKNKLKVGFHDDISYSKNSKEEYCITRNSINFARISRIEMSPLQLKEFLITLANFLAQPIQEHWDGKTIKNLYVA